MTTALAQREPIVAAEDEGQALASIERALHQRHPRRALLVGPDGSETPVPESLYSVLLRAAHELRRGRAVAILPVGTDVTTQQAAELLNVSRPHLIKLLDEGRIPYHKVGTHRRVRLDDLLEFRRIRGSDRRETLGRLAIDAQDLGIYDE